MVLDKLPVTGRPTIRITVGQGLTLFAVGAGGSCLDIFSLFYQFIIISPSLSETFRYGLKYCLKAVKPKTTNQLQLANFAKFCSFFFTSRSFSQTR